MSKSDNYDKNAPLHALDIAVTLFPFFQHIMQESKGRSKYSLLGVFFNIVKERLGYVRISESQIEMLESIKGKIILADGCIMVLDSFTLAKIKKTNFWGKSVTKIYLTDAELRVFHKIEHYWGHAKYPPLYRLAKNPDWLQRRKDWQLLVLSLNAGGLDVKNIGFEHNDYY